MVSEASHIISHLGRRMIILNKKTFAESFPLFLFLFFAGFGVLLPALEAVCVAQESQKPANENSTKPNPAITGDDQPIVKPEPLNKWSDQGSSLGMSLSGTEPGEFIVSKVRPNLAADMAGIEKGDRLVQVGDIDLEKVGKLELGDYLDKLPPNTKIKAVVEREISSEETDTPERQKMTLDLKTDSRAAFDGWVVSERLKKNRVITDHLRATDQLMQLDTLQQSILDDVRGSKTPREAYEAINHRIDELNVSHTAIIPSWGYLRLINRAKGGLGLTMQRQTVDNTNGYFVLDMEPGGPAAKSDLKMGDEILAVNGIELEKSGRLILAGEEQRHKAFMVSSDDEEKITLSYRRTASGKQSKVQLTTDPKLTANSATLNSIRTIEFNGKKFGYLRIWNLMSMNVNQYLKDALEGQFADCDALIVDLRGRGGQISVLLAVEKTLKKSGKPVVAITDRYSRSAKEMLASRLKGAPNVRLVGERTCGAVTAASFVALPSGAALMFPVASGQRLSRYTNGVNLEGRGVEPDEKATFSLPYLAGVDPLMEAAKLSAEKMAKKVATEKASAGK